MIIKADRALTVDGIVEQAVITVEDGVVTAIGSGDQADHDQDARPVHDRLADDHEAAWALPGYVDTHVHGGGGATYSSTDPDQARAVAEFSARHGATTTFASLVTSPVPLLCDQLDVLAGLVEAGVLAGIHLEGPFLSPAKKGAHDESLLIDPDPGTVQRLLDAGRGTVKMITIAPELEHGLEAIAYCRSRGLVVAVGHTDGDAAAVTAGVDAGATAATHLFNAMRSIHHREPGPVPDLLTDPRVTVELIADGIHLHPDVLRMSIAAAGPDRTALVTDAMVATGMSEGRYRLGGLEVDVQGGRARVVLPDGTPGSIAGSTLTLAAAVQYVTGTVGVPLPDAAVMASTTPARLHRLAAGTLEVGRPADLVLTDADGRLRRVLRRGRWLPEPTESGPPAPEDSALEGSRP